MTPETVLSRLRQIDDAALINLTLDVVRYGSGYLKVDANAVKWVPMHEVVDTTPSAEDSHG